MLRRIFCLLALILVALPGCGDGGAEVAKKQFTLLGELRDTLTKVTDAATLKTELPKLEEISKQFAAAQAELNKQQVSTEQQRDIRAKYGKDLEALIGSIQKEADRLNALANIDEKDRDRLVAAITAANSGSTP
jgi:hypothetical protein